MRSIKNCLCRSIIVSGFYKIIKRQYETVVQENAALRRGSEFPCVFGATCATEVAVTGLLGPFDGWSVRSLMHLGG